MIEKSDIYIIRSNRNEFYNEYLSLSFNSLLENSVIFDYMNNYNSFESNVFSSLKTLTCQNSFDFNENNINTEENQQNTENSDLTQNNSEKELDKYYEHFYD